MTTLAVLQPGYLPWLGYFDQMIRADVFLHYDTVQYDKHGWRNRNRIPGPKGPFWLTVPVQAHLGTRLDEVRIAGDPRWKRKHVASLRQTYAQAPHAAPYIDAIAEILERDWDRLLDLDLALTNQMARWLGIATPTALVSEFAVEGSATERLLALCRAVGATRYLTGDAARSYLDVDAFTAAGITVEWQAYRHPVYPQVGQRARDDGEPDFVPYMSAVDLLLNCGPDSERILHQGALPCC